jgi:hypothetical protein
VQTECLPLGIGNPSTRFVSPMLPSNESSPSTYQFPSIVANVFVQQEGRFCTFANDSVAMKSPVDRSPRWTWGKILPWAHLLDLPVSNLVASRSAHIVVLRGPPRSSVNDKETS